MIELERPKRQLEHTSLRPGSGSWFLLGKFSCVIKFFFFIHVFIDSLDSPVPMAFNMMPLSSGGLKGKEEEKKETVRTFFPETWIWDLVTVG